MSLVEPTSRGLQARLGALARPIEAVASGRLPSELCAEVVQVIARELVAIDAWLMDADEERSEPWPEPETIANAALGVRALIEAIAGTSRVSSAVVAAVHSVLVPALLQHLGRVDAATMAELRRQTRVVDLDAFAFDLLRRVGAPTSLADSGVPGEAIEGAAEYVGDAWLAEAWAGRRPAGKAGRSQLGPVPAVGELPPRTATRVVLGVAASREDPGALAHALSELAGRDPSVAIVAVSIDDPAQLAQGVDALERHAAGRPLVLAPSRGSAALVETCLQARPEPRATVVHLFAHGPSAGDPMPAALDLQARRRARVLLTGADEAVGPRGFGNTHATEALPGALPEHQNSPRRPPYGLYAESVHGTPFTTPRAHNTRTWCYRIRPSMQRRVAVPRTHAGLCSHFEDRAPELDIVALAPRQEPGEARDFLDGLVTLGGAGSAALRRGFAVHSYLAQEPMRDVAFVDGDGDLLFIPEIGVITLFTELGPLDVAPGEIAIIPRGLLFSVLPTSRRARGFVAESFGRHFVLPDRGLVGSNGLADARHFRAPAPWYEDRVAPGFRIVSKLGGQLFEATQDHSPFDVVAWHGSLAPHAYDLAHFAALSTVRFDHADPSIHTVVTAPLDEPGTSTLDVMAFVPRWDATSGTFRAPYFHRNAATEINLVVLAPEGGGGPYRAGGCYVTPPSTPHGVSARTVAWQRERSDEGADQPTRVPEGSLWIQLESCLPWSLSPWAAAADRRDPAFRSTRGSHVAYFDPRDREG